MLTSQRDAVMTVVAEEVVGLRLEELEAMERYFNPS